MDRVAEWAINQVGIALVDVGMGPHSHAVAVHLASHAATGDRFHRLGDGQFGRQTLCLCLGYDGAGQRMLRLALDGCRVGEQRPAVCAIAPGQSLGVIEAADVDHRGPARGQGAGLVKGHDLERAEGLEVRAALDQDPGSRRAGDGAHDADRRGDDQGTRTGDDQQHQCPVDPLAKEGAKGAGS